MRLTDVPDTLTLPRDFARAEVAHDPVLPAPASTSRPWRQDTCDDLPADRAEREPGERIVERLMIGSLVVATFLTLCPLVLLVGGKDKGEALEGGAIAAGAVIPLEGFAGAGERGGLAVGPKAEVNLENALLFGLDGVVDLAGEKIEKLTDVDRFAAVGLPRPVVDEEQFDV